MLSKRDSKLARNSRRILAGLLGVLLLAGAFAQGEPTTQPGSRPASARVTPDRIWTSEGWFDRSKYGGKKVERPELPKEITRAFVIPIHGEIRDSTLDVVKRKVLRCKANGAQMVIFDMATPGGGVGAMLGITDQILDELPGVTTVAYVTDEAMSAGAIISLACHEIVMVPDTLIGDSMPIMIGPQGLVPLPKAERAKIESYAMGRTGLIAKRRGHNLDLCKAMITMDMEMWLIRNTKTRELQVVDLATFNKPIANAPLLKGSPFAKSDQAEWEYLDTVVGPTKIVTLNTDQAIRAGLALHVFEDMDALKKHYNITGKVTVLADTDSERLVGFLTSQAVAGLLVAVGMLCLYLEINSPGFGIPGTIAIICFAILFGSRYITGLAQWWEIALFVVGMLLIAAEIFLIPGFGVAGIAGILCCVVSLLAILIANPPTGIPWPDTKGAWTLFTTGIVWLTGAVVVATIAAALLLKHLPKIPLAGRMILPEVAHIEAPPVAESSPMRRIHPGDMGTVEGPCRPVGKVRFGDDLVDAVAEGTMIDRGEKVRALRYEGNRLIVEKVENA